MASLPAGYRAVAPYLFGPDRPAGGYTATGFADLIDAFLPAVGIAKAVVVGHSLGGVVSQLVALRHPARVEKLVLIGTGATLRGHGLAQPLLDQLRREGKNRETMASITRNWFYKQPPPEVFEGYVDAAMRAPADGLMEALASLFEIDLESRLGEIAIPALIVHGAHDHGRKIEHAEGLHQGIRNSRLIVFPDCGHSPMVEDPPGFTRAFHAFLAET
jgi:pimeloyl-ACP methyl ester carboxylesterase